MQDFSLCSINAILLVNQDDLSDDQELCCGHSMNLSKGMFRIADLADQLNG